MLSSPNSSKPLRPIIKNPNPISLNTLPPSFTDFPEPTRTKITLALLQRHCMSEICNKAYKLFKKRKEVALKERTLALRDQLISHISYGRMTADEYMSFSLDEAYREMRVILIEYYGRRRWYGPLERVAAKRKTNEPFVSLAALMSRQSSKSAMREFWTDAVVLHTGISEEHARLWEKSLGDLQGGFERHVAQRIETRSMYGMEKMETASIAAETDRPTETRDGVVNGASSSKKKSKKSKRKIRVRFTEPVDSESPAGEEQARTEKSRSQSKSAKSRRAQSSCSECSRAESSAAGSRRSRNMTDNF